MTSTRLLKIGLVLVLGFGTIPAQDLGDQLRKLGKENAKGYVGPLLAGWGAGLNSGFYHTADLHAPLGFDVQVKITLAQLTAGDKVFSYRLPAQITVGPQTFVAGTDYPSEVQSSTAVGSKGQTVVQSFSGTELAQLPGGLDMPSAPLIVPQLVIGLPFGFEVMGRFFPTTKLGDVGKINMLGFGLRYDIDQYFPLLPLDVSIHFMTQKLTFQDAGGSDLIKGSATAYGLEVSKKILVLTIYGGVQLEDASWTVGPYTASVPGSATPVSVEEFTVDSRNSSRLLIGARVQMVVLNLHVDYALATTPVITFGAGITFR
jgi:hypothetical protein